MTKQMLLDSTGTTVRKVTKQDMIKASTDYQRNSKYVIQLANGSEYYSKRATMNDIMQAIKLQ